MEASDALDELLTCRLDFGPKAIEPCTIVIFGASGDLTARKLIPALYHLYVGKQLPSPFRILGFARSAKDEPAWREELKQSVEKFSRTKQVDPGEWKAFAANLYYSQGDYSDLEGYRALAKRIAEAPQEPLRRNLLFYLATPPSQFAEVTEHLWNAKLLLKESGPFWQRIV